MHNFITKKNDLFGFDLFDSFDSLFRPVYRANSDNTMRTDIKEKDNNYILETELAGYNKEDLALRLEDGYLTITATKTSKTTDETKENYIRKERVYGSVSRSFYVGADVKEEDINAAYNNGVLTLSFPKEVPAKPIEKKAITIK